MLHPFVRCPRWPQGRVWLMVAGGGASVIYTDTVADLGFAHVRAAPMRPCAMRGPARCLSKQALLHMAHRSLATTGFLGFVRVLYQGLY